MLGAKPLTEFANVSDGNHMSISERFIETGGVPYYRGQDIYHFFIEQSKTPIKIDEATFRSSVMTRSRLRKGDVLMSIVGAIIGNLSLVKTDANASCSCKLAILRPSLISPELLATFLQSYYGQIQVQKFKRGAAQTGLILEDFDQLKIPKFTKIFQDAIVLIVDFAFKITETAQQAHIKAEALLLNTLGMSYFASSVETINVKTFKDSFATTGRLDAEFYQPKYEQIVGKITAQAHARLGDLANIQKSIEPGSEAYSDDEDGLPFLRVADYDRHGITTPQKRLNRVFIAENSDNIEALKPKKHTILFSKDGSVGEAYCLPEDSNFITSGAVLHLTVRNPEEVLPEYLTLALNSKLVKMQAERDVGGSIILHWRADEIKPSLCH